MFKGDDIKSYLLSSSVLGPELKAVCLRMGKTLSPLLWSQYTLIFGILAKDKGFSLKTKD